MLNDQSTFTKYNMLIRLSLWPIQISFKTNTHIPEFPRPSYTYMVGEVAEKKMSMKDKLTGGKDIKQTRHKILFKTLMQMMPQCT